MGSQPQNLPGNRVPTIQQPGSSLFSDGSPPRRISTTSHYRIVSPDTMSPSANIHLSQPRLPGQATSLSNLSPPSLFDSPSSPYFGNTRHDYSLSQPNLRRNLYFDSFSGPSTSRQPSVAAAAGLQSWSQTMGNLSQSGSVPGSSRQVSQSQLNPTLHDGLSHVQSLPASSVQRQSTQDERGILDIRQIQQQLMQEGDQIVDQSVRDESAIRQIQEQLAEEGEQIMSQERRSSQTPVINNTGTRVNANTSSNVDTNVGETPAEGSSQQQDRNPLNDDVEVIDLTQSRRRLPSAPSAGVVDLTEDEGYPLHRTRNVIDLTAAEVTTSDDDDASASDVPMETEVGEEKIDNSKEVEPVAASAAAVTSDGDDAEGCPICFEEWTNSGEHRLVSLRCGHLFGQSCIETWLKSAKKCPQCNAKAKKSELRVIYAKALKVLDTTDRDHALQALEKEKEARNKSEMEAADLRMKYQMIAEEHKRLKEELERQSQHAQLSRASMQSTSRSASTSNTQTAYQGLYKMMYDLVVSKEGMCRVAAHSEGLAQLVISVPSCNPMFKDYFGIKKISMMDKRNTQHVHIHKKMIRDMAFKPYSDDGLLLSCSLDKTVKVTSLMTNTVVQTWDAPSPLWTCCWDRSDLNYFYTGLTNGNIIQYDVRDTTKCVREFNNNCTKPVVSLRFISQSQQFGCKGLLVGQMDKVTFYESLNGYFRPHMLPMSGNRGNLISLSHDVESNNLLATYRPNSTVQQNVLHKVLKLRYNVNSGTSSVSTEQVRMFHGGNTMKLLTRSCLVNQPQCGILACAGDEASQSVNIWNANTGVLQQTLKGLGAIVDVCAFTSNRQSFLAALSEKNVHLYKWHTK